MSEIKLKFTAKPKDIIMFIIFCIFLLYLVAIGVLNLYEITHNNMFWGLNPFPAFNSQFRLATITMYVCALIAVFMSTSSYFFDREKGFGFGKKKDKDEPGWSRWMKEDEMKKAYDVKEITLNADTYEHAGIPIILNEDKAWVDDGENHSLIIGASGSGKTATVLDPLVKILGKAGESMIVTDPKGEIYEHNANLLREKGYNVIIVNFRDPEHGSAWNPLTLPYRYWKQGKEDKAMELLEDLATNILVDSTNNNDPFWQKTAADYFTGLALGLFEDAKSEDEINLNSINAMSTFGEERCGASKYDKEYFKLKGELSSAYISAAATITAPADTKGGITSTFRQKVRIFSSRQKLAEMLSYTDFDVTKIGKEKTAVFLKIHDEKTTYHALATIFVKQAYEALIAVAQTCPGLKLPYRTNFILDEFANMPALKDVESMITASRSRNMRFSFVIQNFSQLNKVYGKDVAETIKGNCGNFVYIMSTELAALEEISKLLGDQKPEKAEKDKPAPPIRPLFTVSDLQALKEGEVIINRFRSMPFKTKLTYDWETDWGKKYSEMSYTERPHREVKVFDLKDFVSKLKEKQGANFNPMGGIPGMGMPGMPGMGMPSGFGPIPSSRPTNNMSTSLDDYVRRLDEKIAELEREEALEKAKLEEKNKESLNTPAKSESEITSEINNILEDKKEEVKEEKVIPTKANYFETIEPLPEENNIPVETKETVEESTVEKPKVNVDVDSVVVNNKPNNDDFFDDFFGGEDE